MEDEARLAELFSLAQKKNQYGSLVRRLSNATTQNERDMPVITSTLKTQDVGQSFNQDMLNHSI